jgi:hypothetical protein
MVQPYTVAYGESVTVQSPNNNYDLYQNFQSRPMWQRAEKVKRKNSEEMVCCSA